MAMSLLSVGLYQARAFEDALSVQEAELSMKRRFGGSEAAILAVQGNLAGTYYDLARYEEALQLRREVYSGRLKLNGKEHESTILAAHNLAFSLVDAQRFEEARSVLRKMVPVAPRIIGSNDEITLRIRTLYAAALYEDDRATLDDLRESVATLEELARTARRVLGGSHPVTEEIEDDLRAARAALRAREAVPK